MVKASFVVPCRNGEKYLTQTINSILNQTVKEIELVIVDDHSTDNTSRIAHDFAEKDKRVILANLEDKEGVGAGRNLGTRLARGDIIIPSDADDPCYPNKADIIVSELEKNKADIFYGNVMRFYTKTGTKELRHFQPYDQQLLKYINFIANPCSGFYKHVFDKVKGYDESIRIGEDYDFWLSAQDQGFKFSSKNIALSQYTMHEGQSTSINNPKKIAQRIEWNRIIRKKHKIYEIDVEYVKKTVTPEVYDFYINKNFDIWFSKDSIPSK